MEKNSRKTVSPGRGPGLFLCIEQENKRGGEWLQAGIISRLVPSDECFGFEIVIDRREGLKSHLKIFYWKMEMF
jgi:hypothetical protein